MTVQVLGNLSPFGKPITCAVIRITCVDSDVILEGSKLHTCTNDVGDYSFDLEDGAYLVEYKQKDVMVEIGYIYINETTPTPTDLISLVNSSPLVPIPDVPTTDTDWDTEISLHEGDAVKNYELNQAVSNEASSLDYEEASSTANSYLGRSIDEVKSKHSQSTKQVTTFSEEGNSLVIDEDTLSTSNITKSKNTSLFEDTDEEYKESDELTTTRVKASKTIQHSKYLTDYKTTITQNITSDFGYKNKEIEFIQNDQREVTTNRESESLGIDKDGYTSTVGREDSIVASYRDDDSIEVLKPQIEKSSKSTIQGDTNFVEVEEATKQNVNKDNESFGSWYKKITTYTKEAVDRLTNDGITSVKEYIVDIFKVGNLIEANSVTNQVKINGQLIINNPEDFQGDTIFEVFQYSVDGVNDWHDEFVTKDLWRRFNTSVNGYVDPLKWSEPMLLQAQDGSEGDTVYYEYRYSSDNSSWHSVFVDGDIWRQERVIENGFPINDWSSSARIKGADGEAGDTVYIEYQYSIDGLAPWHSNFSTGDHYRRERLVTNGIAGAWSDAAKVVPVKGEDYFDGYNSVTLYLYQRGVSTPPLPTTESTYNYSSRELVGFNNGWSTTIPEGTEPLYVTAATASSYENVDTISAGEWADAVLLAQSGDTVYPEYQYSSDGISGWHDDFLSTDYFRRERTIVISPTGTTTGNWSTGVRIRKDGYTPEKGVDYFDGVDGSFTSYIYKLSDFTETPDGGSFDGSVEIVPTGWSDNPVYNSTTKTQVSTCRYVKQGNEWIRSPDWSASVQWLGVNGDTIYIEYQYSSDGNSNWHDDFLPDDYFRRERIVRVINESNTIYSSWTNGVRVRKDGEDGEDGYTPVKGIDYFDGSDGSDGSDGIDGSFVSFVYKLSDEVPAVPTGGSFDGTNEVIPTGWSDNPVYSSSAKTWVSQVKYVNDGSSWSRDSAWSTPVQWLGVDGENGVSTAVITLYQRATSVPPVPSNSLLYNFFNGSLTSPNNGWSREVPTGENPLYITTSVATSLIDTDVIDTDDWSAPAVLVKNGNNGTDGAGMYWIEKPNAWFPVNWSLAYQDFYDTFGKFPVNQDHLTYTNDPNNSKDATLSETARWDGTNWIEPAMIVDGDMLVKGTVTAEHIQAKSLTGGEISSSTTVIAGSGNNQAGMNGHDSGIYNGWRFWAGNATPSSAPYRVNRAGSVWMNNATIAGSSTFSGTLNVKSSTSGARMEITNSRISVRDSSGTLRVRIGQL